MSNIIDCKLNQALDWNDYYMWSTECSKVIHGPFFWPPRCNRDNPIPHLSYQNINSTPTLSNTAVKVSLLGVPFTYTQSTNSSVQHTS